MRGSTPEPAEGFLYGLPIIVKDLTAVAGVRWTEGSRIFADRIAERSDILVERLEANGAIVIAKSNTPEFGAGGNTVNDVFGHTCNPWDTRLTSGGSSGGSAAAIASGEGLRDWQRHGGFGAAASLVLFRGGFAAEPGQSGARPPLARFQYVGR